MTVRAVLFDLDGTLADTLEDISTAMNRALAAHGLPEHAPDAYRKMVGDGAAMLAHRAVLDRTDLEAQVLEAYTRRYDQHIVDSTKPYPGVDEMLRALAARGVGAAVLSNKPDRATRDVVERLFGLARFVDVRGERAGAPRKPDPTVAIELARQLGLAPQDVAFVGDTSVDMRTACAAAMLPVGVLWGFRDEPELRAAGARVIVSQPSEILALFEPGRAA